MIIINRDKAKRLGIITAIILIPVVGLLALNQSIEYRSKPASQVENQRTNLEMAVNQDLHERLTRSAQEQVNFFADYRIKRQQVRGERMELLKEIAANPAAEIRARDAAELKIIALSERTEKELQAETLVKSYGIEECAVIIEEQKVTVIVDELKGEAQQTEIINAVSRATGNKAEEIQLVLHNLTQ